MMSSLYAVVVAIFLLLGGSHAQDTLNVTLDSESLLNSSDLTVILTGTVKVYCQEGQNLYHVYNIPEEDYDGCHNPGKKVIGSCMHSPLAINIRTLSMAFSGLVSYELGKTYHFGVYIPEYSSNGVISYNNQPCVDGMKFSFTIVSNLPENITSSEVISPTSSLTVTTTTPIPTTNEVSKSVSLSSSVFPSAIRISSSSSASIMTTVTKTMRSSYTPTTKPTNEPTDIDEFVDRTSPFVEGVADHGYAVSSSLPFLFSCVTIVLLLLLRVL